MQNFMVCSHKKYNGKTMEMTVMANSRFDAVDRVNKTFAAQGYIPDIARTWLVSQKR